MLKLLALDRFTILLVLMVLLATLLPISGQLAYYFNILTTVAIAVLFFLHGAKLSREAVIEGMLHWRMHALVFIFTFLIFPLIGLLFAFLGNYFKTIKPNYFIGIRTPWTLENEEVWKKTHLIGGKLWFVGGLLMALTFVLPNEMLER